MLYVIPVIVLLICAIYLIYCAFQDSCLYAILIFLFGPLVAWAYVLFIWKVNWPKKIIFLIVYYIAVAGTLYFIYFANPMFSNPELMNEETTQNEEVNQPVNLPEESREEYDPDFYTGDE